jgi:hypothetical protein
MLAKSDEKAILFAGLGCQSTILDLNARLEFKLSKHRPGLFKHIYHFIKEIATITTMETLYKIKVLCTISDSMAITSFDKDSEVLFEEPRP